MNYRTVLTISISLEHLSYQRRIMVLPSLLSYPIHHRKELMKEYTEWCVLKLLNSNTHKMLYILDHFVLWYFYCLVSVFKGKASGHQWECHYDFELTGMRMDIDSSRLIFEKVK